MAAKFIYPPDGNFSTISPAGTININDGFFVTYTSRWPQVNLTFGCEWTAGRYWPYEAKENPLAGSGTFMVNSLSKLGPFGGITRFPAKCNLKLTNPTDREGIVIGQDFTVDNATAATTTYLPFATSTANNSVVTVTFTPSSSPSSSPNLITSTSMSPGLIAGIVIGSLVVIAFIVSLIWLLRSQRIIQNRARKSSGNESLQLQGQARTSSSPTSYLIPVLPSSPPVSSPEITNQLQNFRNSYIPTSELHGNSKAWFGLESTNLSTNQTSSRDSRSQDARNQEGRSLISSP